MFQARIHRSHAPICEFTDNEKLIVLADIHLFPSGRGLLSNGPVKPKQLKHFMFFHDARFATDFRFIYTLFSQFQRHKASQIISLRINESQKEFLDDVLNDTTLVEAVNEVGIEGAQLTPAQKSKITKLQTLLSASSSQIPFSPLQSRSNLSKIYAMVHLYGLPSWWVTLSPSDNDQILALKIHLADPIRTSQNNVNPFEHSEGMERTENGFINDLLVSTDTQTLDLPIRRTMIADNPVATVRIFRRLVDAVIRHLFRIPSQEKQTSLAADLNPGILGTALSSFFVIEAQGRGSLHIHGLVFGFIPPEIFQRFSHNPVFVENLRTSLDSIIWAHLPQEYFLNRTTISKVRHALNPFSPSTTSNFDFRAACVISSANFHMHAPTCAKNKSKSCRMGMPCPVRTDPTGPIQLTVAENGDIQAAPEISEPPSSGHSDHRIIVWEFHRPTSEDGWIVSTSP